ncbi:hypothetical protein AXF42_Ash001873 [Apostasia shenzhenica]|uniref:Uncharacterized protein n=1 Tax=Apostasia shenzhenica TaxID=1088818 RepID=A0A2I0ABG9_9ASPA|nr:hypothetical protein AXF42_Ash001873 [Apostasia shenzhenica]
MESRALYHGRTTRYSSSLPPSTPSPKALNSSSSQTQTAELITDPASSEDPVSLETLISFLPGRRPQIMEIMRLIGPLNSPMLPLLLYGGPSTGKTATILQIFRHLNRPFVYAGCRTCYCSRVLFNSVLSQLLPQKRNSGAGYRRCEKPSEFIDILRSSLVREVNALRKRNRKLGSGEIGRGDMIYLIFDNVELVRSWDKSSGVIPLLFRIHDILKMPEIGIIYLSSSTPDAYYSSTGSIEPIYVYFSDYILEDLHALFMRNQSNPKLYSSFLSVVLKPFYRVTRRVDVLSVTFKSLFQKYCEPLTDQSLVLDEAFKRRLFDNLQPHLLASLNDVFIVLQWCSNETKLDEDSKRKAIKKSIRKEGFDELDFYMPMSLKYLLLSAFMASRNPATLDAALFDSTGCSNNRKRRKKNLQTSMDRKDNMAEEILLKGPGSFPLERLLAIYQCITSVGEIVADEEQVGTSNASGADGLTSDILFQLSTLCNANFISKASGCPLEGSGRYRCTIEEEMAVKVSSEKGKLPPFSQYFVLDVEGPGGFLLRKNETLLRRHGFLMQIKFGEKGNLFYFAAIKSF